MICPSCREENDEQAVGCFNCGHQFGPVVRRGTILASRYEILERLGSGGMGTVYKAQDRVLDETVAIKVLRPEIARAPDMARRFHSEIKLARRVRHPNVCGIHEYGEDGDIRFISMELIEGTDLKRIIRDKGVPPLEEAYEIPLQLAEGLGAMHELGIIHRDLKTANVMRDKRGIVRLMDFGIAKQLGTDAGATATATGHILGTPEYMSPEQARSEPLDPRSDIYALGIVIYEIFTGRVPFHGDTPVATLLKQVQEQPPLDPARAKGIPAPLVPVLRKALAKNAAERQATTKELIEDLRRARDASLRPAAAASAPPPPAPAPAPPTARMETPLPAPRRVEPPPAPAERPPAGGRRRGFLAAGLAILAGVLVAGGIGLTLWSALPPEPTPGPPTSSASAPPLALASMPPSAAPAVAIAPTPTVVAATTTLTTQPPAPVFVPATRPAHPEPAATPRSDRGAAQGRPELPIASMRPLPETPAPTLAPKPEAAPGTLQIVVRPWAEVSIDGAVVGTTPFRPVTLAPGPHTIALSHPEYKTLHRKVSVRSREATRLEVDLAWEAFRR